MGSEFRVGDVKITWMGHATFLIEHEGKVIYLDPYVVSENLPKADIVFITHEHFDHCNLDALNKIINDNTIIIAPESCKIKLSRIKNEKIFVKEGEEKEIDGIKFKVVPAYNLNKPFHPKGKGVGYVIDLGIKIYHAGDTDFIPEMKELKNIDICLLPVGGTYTMNLSEAIEAVKSIKPKYFIPMHYNYLPELKLSKENLIKVKDELKGITEVIILDPLLT